MRQLRAKSEQEERTREKREGWKREVKQEECGWLIDERSEQQEQQLVVECVGVGVRSGGAG